MKKYKMVICIIIVLLFLIIIQVAFSFPAPTEWLVAVWDAGDFINFSAAIVFGVFAAWQSKKVIELNVIQMYSMIALNKVMFVENDIKTPKVTNLKISIDEYIDFCADNYSGFRCFHFDIEFENQSEYPIVKFSAQAIESDGVNLVDFSLKKSVETKIHIPAGRKYAIRFIIPSKAFSENNVDILKMQLCFTNVYTCHTNAVMQLNGMQKTMKLSRDSYKDFKAEFNLDMIANLGTRREN